MNHNPTTPRLTWVRPPNSPGLYVTTAMGA